MNTFERWLHAQAALSLLYRGMEEENARDWSGLFSLAAERLRLAELVDLAAEVEAIVEDWGAEDEEVRAIMGRVRHAADKLEAEPP